jgi:hypothetical protein
MTDQEWIASFDFKPRQVCQPKKHRFFQGENEDPDFRVFDDMEMFRGEPREKYLPHILIAAERVPQ